MIVDSAYIGIVSSLLDKLYIFTSESSVCTMINKRRNLVHRLLMRSDIVLQLVGAGLDISLAIDDNLALGLILGITLGCHIIVVSGSVVVVDTNIDRIVCPGGSDFCLVMCASISVLSIAISDFSGRLTGSLVENS